MKSYILCRQHFSDAYVEKIKACADPAWHCHESRHPVNAAIQPPNILLILGGAPSNQKEQSVTVRFGGGSAKGTFQVALADLKSFFQSANADADAD
jgi:hypothetical protein